MPGPARRWPGGVLTGGDDAAVSYSLRHRYLIVLVLILVTIAFQLAARDGEIARMISVVLQAATLIAAVATAGSHIWVVRITVAVCVVLVLAAAGAVLGTERYGGDAARVVSLLLVSLAPPALVVGLRNRFRQAGGITMHTMFGVLCLYLLIGLLFGTLFDVIVSISGDPFFTAPGTEQTSDFLYFSYATLTTVGYGDLTAATGLGRSLAITEALIGQIYLVTVVALIVSQLGTSRARQDA